MSEPSSPDVQTDVLRVQRILEEALDRHADQSEAARAEALTRTLRAEVAALASASRGPVLAALAALYPEEPAITVGPAASDGQATRRLEEEVQRLREALAAAQATPATPSPAPAPPSGPLLGELAKVIVGSSRRAALAGTPGAEERMLGVIRALLDLAAGLARGYLSVGLEADKTMAGHLQMVMADEVEGKRPAGSVKALLEQMRQQIGIQVLAFRRACDVGARELLRQLAPGSLAAAAGKSRLFYYKECWDAFEARYEELRRADNIFETYFDVAFQREMRGLLTRATREKDENT
jgi:hypothetical protein